MAPILAADSAECQIRLARDRRASSHGCCHAHRDPLAARKMAARLLVRGLSAARRSPWVVDPIRPRG